MTTADAATTADAGAATPACRVVAIGSSAGGLVALKALFAQLPAAPGAAFVVVSHLDPEHRSELATILSRHTAMPVAEVTDALDIERDHVYVVAPNRELQFADGCIASHPFTEPRGHRTPIDRLFHSLAAHHRDGLAVVLSGSGSDGSLGVRAVKGAGGVVLAQDPDEAEYASMPRSAVATGCVDVVAPVAELARRIATLVGRTPPLQAAADGDDGGEAMRRILAYLRAQTGHDFSGYKTPTILRRLGRRMQLHQLQEMDDYLALLRADVEEVQALFGDLLISVTSFFRDPEAFEALATQVVPGLLARVGDDSPLRVWVPGCATGEEAYSLAMLLLEGATRLELQRDIQIFATDVDAAALEIAREGLYPAAIESDVGAERLQRFFTREGEHYRIRRTVRDLMVFAGHSLLKDPPFSRLDLISCRNVLIYLGTEAQRRVLGTLHYALKADGFLLLGSAESADAVTDAFRVLDRKHRIYQALRRAGRPPLLPRTPTTLTVTTPRGRSLSAAAGDEAASHRRALEQLAPPSILVDAEQRVLHLSESVGRFLQHPAGALTSHIVQLVRPELKFELSRGLHVAFERGQASLGLPVPVQFDGAPRRVIVHVQPVRRDDVVVEALVMFLDGGAAETVETTVASGADDEIDAELVGRLYEELEFAQEQLRASRSEYETTNEELRAANEELQSINEEYRSTSEELETSKEELQSMNEELQTVNAELKAKLEGLSLANANLQNLMAAMEGGTLFLDTALRIRLFTPGVAGQFNITAADSGRPITDFTHRLKYQRLVEDAREVLRELIPIQREVESRSGEWFLLRIRPYRTLEERIEGVVVTLIDITQLHRAEAALKDSEARFRALVTATSYVVYRMSPDWSEMRELDGAGFIADTTQPSRDWLDTYIDPADQQQVRQAITEAIRQRRTFELEHRVKRPDGGLGWTLSRAVPRLDADGNIVEWFGAASDVSKRRRTEEELARAHRIETVGRLAGGIAHDFNNLLTVITANLEMAELRISDVATRELIERAAQAAALGASFNKRLLSLAGQHRYDAQRVDLNARIADVVELLRRALDERIELHTQLATQLWPVHVDPFEIDSALLNLALNARDAMNEGGRIVVATGNVSRRRDGAAGDYVCLSVTDTGTGMSAETLRHATDAFFSTKESGLGTGLGLFSVQAFARQAGGFLELASSPGAGTTVSLLLPRATAVEDAGGGRDDDAAATPRGQGERILVVEDDDNVRAIARCLLEALDYTVLEARTAAEARARLTPDADIRLVFSDVVMPGGMSGIELARWIGRERPATRVLLTSGYSTEPGTGTDGVRLLPKPYSRAELGRAIHAELARD